MEVFAVYEKSYNACTLLHADLLPLQYSHFCLTRECASLYLHCYYFENASVHAATFSSPKQNILHRYRNDINTVNQLQLNYFTKIHLLLYLQYWYRDL